MTIDGLLTFSALLVAVYTVMSRVQRLNLQLKVRASDIIVSALAFFLVNALEFHDPLVKMGWASDLTSWPVKPNELAYLVILIVVPALAFSVYLAPLPRHKIRKYRDLVEELITQGYYAELLSLVEAHLGRLIRIYKGDFLIPRLQKYVESLDTLHDVRLEAVARMLLQDHLAEHQEEKRTMVASIKIAAIWIAKKAVRMLPSSEIQQQVAKEVFRGALLRPDFVRSVVQIRPYFGVRLLKADIDEKYEFSNDYFRELISDTTSVLYLELKNNQNLSSRHRYALPEENRLLHYLFRDAHVAEALGVWQPIGEQMIAELDRLHHDPENDRYNLPLEDYQERRQWECPLFIGTRFFDIMVSEAIEQNISWHMWLYYFTHFTDRICRNYRLDPEKTDPDSEFPTIYSYLLYELVWTLREWIWKVTQLPAGHGNAVLESTSLTHENGNPIKSSILALGECVRTVLCEERIPIRLKRAVGSIALNLFFDLVRRNAQARYAQVLRNALMIGGVFERHDEGPEYLGNIIHALVNNDNVPHRHNDVSELLTALAHRFFDKFRQEPLSRYVHVEPWNSQMRLSSRTNRHSYVIN